MPIISTKVAFITEAIEAQEGRIGACFDIPGAYLYADCSDNGGKFMLLKEKLAEFMVLIEPKL